MAGFENDIMFCKNGDFTKTDNQTPSESNGLITNGQLWIGATSTNAGGTHINVGSITAADASITIGYSSPNITVKANMSGGGFLTWVDNNTAITAAINTGYFITGACTVTLPLTVSQGNAIAFIVDTTSALTIKAGTGQIIRLGTTPTAATGTAVNTAIGDSITLIYRDSDTTWLALSSIGLWNLT